MKRDRSIAEQDDLNAKGRTTSGSIITHAPDGLSFHNYGLAIDIAIMSGKSVMVNMLLTPEIVAAAKKQGFEWGGNWLRPKTDPPHFQMTFGNDVHQLHKIYKGN
jgi:peptidoglycan LD-endopeptidase CwlK